MRGLGSGNDVVPFAKGTETDRACVRLAVARHAMMLSPSRRGLKLVGGGRGGFNAGGNDVVPFAKGTETSGAMPQLRCRVSGNDVVPFAKGTETSYERLEFSTPPAAMMLSPSRRGLKQVSERLVVPATERNDVVPFAKGTETSQRPEELRRERVRNDVVPFAKGTETNIPYELLLKDFSAMMLSPSRRGLKLITFPDAVAVKGAMMLSPSRRGLKRGYGPCVLRAFHCNDVVPFAKGTETPKPRMTSRGRVEQ